MKILCIGLSSYDVTYPMDHYIKENTKHRINNRIECGGGPANNAAYLLGKWGMNVYYAGVVGSDRHGKLIKQELESVNVNTDYLETKKDMITVVSNIIANITDGTRTILTYCPDNYRLEELDINFKPDIILLDGHEYDVSMEILNKYPNSISIIDAGRNSDEVIELSKKVKYLVCSKEFAENVTDQKFDFNDSKTIVSIYSKMKEIFKNTIIITLESRGSLYEKDGKIKIMPSLKVKSIDSTGAGDFFHGAFTYAIANNKSIDDALKLSNITGALSVTKLGSKNSAPSKEEVEKIYNEYR